MTFLLMTDLSAGSVTPSTAAIHLLFLCELAWNHFHDPKQAYNLGGNSLALLEHFLVQKCSDMSEKEGR
eukprot:14300184-Ditylum_brightwellii.AAC.1